MNFGLSAPRITTSRQYRPIPLPHFESRPRFVVGEGGAPSQELIYPTPVYDSRASANRIGRFTSPTQHH